MLAKIFTMIVMIVVWLCLNNLNIELTRVLFSLGAVLTSYFFASWLDILPKNIKVNHNFIFYFFWLIKQIVSSSIAVIKIIWSKNEVKPIFEWIDAKQQSDIGLVIYANSITLTPGTVTLDIKDNMLLVHALEKVSIQHLKEAEMDQRVKKIIIE